MRASKSSSTLEPEDLLSPLPCALVAQVRTPGLENWGEPYRSTAGFAPVSARRGMVLLSRHPSASREPPKSLRTLNSEALKAIRKAPDACFRPLQMPPTLKSALKHPRHLDASTEFISRLNLSLESQGRDPRKRHPKAAFGSARTALCSMRRALKWQKALQKALHEFRTSGARKERPWSTFRVPQAFQGL